MSAESWRDKYPGLIPFKPGQSGNPGGRPTGTRNSLQTAFLKALAADFDAEGPAAIRRCREEKPDVYVRVVAALMPKEVELKNPLQDMNDEQLIAAVRTLESFLAARSAPEGSADPGESPSVN